MHPWAPQKAMIQHKYQGQFWIWLLGSDSSTTVWRSFISLLYIASNTGKFALWLNFNYLFSIFIFINGKTFHNGVCWVAIKHFKALEECIYWSHSELFACSHSYLLADMKVFFARFNMLWICCASSLDNYDDIKINNFKLRYSLGIEVPFIAFMRD